jgi:hypothetical protein
VSLQAVALQKQAYDITGREADIGFIGLASSSRRRCSCSSPGSVADRFDRRIVALFAVGGELVSSVALMIYSTVEPTAVFPLFVIAFGYGIARAFQAPAMRSMPPMVAPEGGLPRTIALFSATWTTASSSGPRCRGSCTRSTRGRVRGSSTLILLGWAGVLFVRFVRRPPPLDPDERPSLHSAMEGLRFIKRTPVLLAAISLDLFAVLFGGAVALLPVIAEERLHVGDIAYGWLRAAPGFGAAAMAITIALRRSASGWDRRCSASSRSSARRLSCSASRGAISSRSSRSSCSARRTW